MQPRLTSELIVSALRRRAEMLGGFAAVVARGDATAGAILVILAEKGRKIRFLERVLDLSGRYRWHELGGQAAHNEEDSEKFLARKRKSDPDLWLIELDVPSAERFTAEINDIV